MQNDRARKINDFCQLMERRKNVSKRRKIYVAKYGKK